MRRLGATLAALAVAGVAGLLGLAPATAQELLEPRDAFAFTATPGNGGLIVRYDVAEGYYMYKSRFLFSADTGEIPAGQVRLPPGTPYRDEFFGDMEIYRGNVEIGVPAGALPAGGDFVVLKVISQGCADIGVCYPPMTSEATLALASFGAGGPGGGNFGEVADSEEIFARETLASGSGLLVVGAFFLFGALLAFTPCVLPMVPVLAGVLARGRSAPARIALGGVFTLGLASTYTALGVAAGLGGAMFSYALQQPPALATYATVLVLLAASLFGWVKLGGISPSGAGGGAKKSNGYAGALFMGMFSSLITSACVAPPLAAALLYISKSGDALLGGTALFAMALGMAAPLAAVLSAGISSGPLVRRVGPYTGLVRAMLGYLMLSAAAWIVAPLMSVPAQMVLQGLIWTAASAHLALGLFRGHGAHRLAPKALAALAPAAAGLAYLVGGATGGPDPLNPLAHLWKEGDAIRIEHEFVRLDGGDIDGLVASLDARPTMLYFTADWCVSCMELERFTFSDIDVAKRLGQFNLVKIDMSEMTPAHRELLRRYDLVGPPGIVLVGPGGRTLAKLVGYKPPERFLRAIGRAPPGSLSSAPTAAGFAQHFAQPVELLQRVDRRS